MSNNPFDELLPWWRRPRALVAFSIVVVLVWWVALREPEPQWIPGQSVMAVPDQQDTQRDPWKWEDGSQITPLAEYAIEARVLGRKNYSDAGARFSPMDLALGWGPMSDEKVLSSLDFRQSGRWYHYSWSGSPPIPPGQIIQHSSNTHIIPANPEVAAALDEIGRGDRVRLTGALVAVKREDGWRWRSSLTRKDTGDGSCELMWVEKVERLTP